MAKRVFISYKRNAEPDEPLVHDVRAALEEAGYSTFIDQIIPIGLKWAEEIERELKNCDAFLIFLTALSSRSEMVQSEVEMARRYQRTILPIRVAFAGKLPHPLNAYLDPIEYALWRGSSDTPQLIANLKKAIDGIPLPAHSGIQQKSLTHHVGTLPPAPGGAMDLEDPHYIERPYDQQALRLAASPGQTIVLKGPRQVGKTSLLFRMMDGAGKNNKSVAFVDCQLFEANSLDQPVTFYTRFAAEIAQSLDITNRPNPETPHDLTRWMEQEVIKKLPGAVALAIDESERLLWAGFREDFFGMLRSWHNLRANPIRRDWRKLDLYLVTSTEPALLIQGAQSPFNVGTVLDLRPFDIGALGKLNRAYGEPLNDAELARLLELVGGQPYLTRKAFYEISPPNPRMTPDHLFEAASTDGGPFRDHLRRFLFLLLEHQDVREAMHDILQGRGCRDPRLIYRLESAGLISTDAGQHPRPSCKLYGDFLKERLA
jgi:hypothetical protein